MGERLRRNDTEAPHVTSVQSELNAALTDSVFIDTEIFSIGPNDRGLMGERKLRMAAANNSRRETGGESRIPQQIVREMRKDKGV